MIFKSSKSLLPPPFLLFCIVIFSACTMLSPVSETEKDAETKTQASITLTISSELEEKVIEALDYDGPVIVEVFTPITLTAAPKQVSYKRKDGQMESLPLEYMNPPISDEEMRENMLIPMYEKR